MKKFSQIVSWTFLLLAFNKLKAQDILLFNFSDHLNFIPNCSNKPFGGEVKFWTNSEKSVKIFSIKANSNEYTVEFNGKTIDANDTIWIDKSIFASLNVCFPAIPKNQDSLLLTFETSIDSIDTYKKNEIPLDFKQFVISGNDLFGDDNFILELTKSCLDSIKVYFPFGGTETTISLYKSGKHKKPFQKLWYEFSSDAKNYITFSKKDIGRYYVTFASCHWGTAFRIIIE